MRPPNLEIEAERQYTVERGLTKGQPRNYVVGFEGAGLETDDYIKTDHPMVRPGRLPASGGSGLPRLTPPRIAKTAVPKSDEPRGTGSAKYPNFP